MNLIDQTFAQLKREGRSALMPFLTIGDPDLETSLKIIKEVEAAGADLVELGVPYSDPLADGPVIQRASQRALQQKVTIHDCIALAKRARAEGVKMPFVLFTYYNPILQLGPESFFQQLVDHEISGVIIPDLPYEEDDAVRTIAERYHIQFIPLVAPTSKERIEKITSRASGFIYCVSSMGVTGVRSEFAQDIDEFLSTVKASTDVPIAVGFGISNKDHVARFTQICDGIIVGSAIVREIEANLALLQSTHGQQEGLANIREFVANLKSGTDRAVVERVSSN